VKIYTRKGDDGTTGLFFGGRVGKDSAVAAAGGDVDEAQAALGVARARAVAAAGGSDGASAAASAQSVALIVGLQRDLWVLMAELATAPENRHKLTAGQTLVTAEMVERLEALIDDISSRFDPPTEFVVPGQDMESALLDLARTVVRRAERTAVPVAAGGSQVVPYLNRLSDLLWTMARWREQEFLPSREKM